MKSKHILHRDSPLASNIKLAGAKAARLSLLAKHDIPVPDFYVVTTHACKTLKSLPLSTVKKNLEKQFSPVKIYNQYAVRSSAPFEDHASFSLAGQFQTLLNKSKDELSDSVHKCWQSLDSPQVKTYLDQFGYMIKNPTMAVMLQQMIKPDYAGVLFTMHPVSEDDQTFLVEIVSDYGEALVSGQSDPLRITVNRSDLSIKNIFGNKHVFKVLETLPLFKQNFNTLLKLSLKVESILGKYQDIEWAVQDDKVWILQSRPITRSISKQHIKVDQDGRIWTDYFFAERFTQPLSPLGWSILQKWMEKNAYRSPLTGLGFRKQAKDKNLTRLFNGYPFTNISVFQHLYSVIPLSFISHDKQAFLLLEHRNAWLSNIWRGFLYLFTLIVTLDFNWLPGVNLLNWKRFTKKNKFVLNKLKNQLGITEKLESVFIETEQLTDQFLSLHRWSITFADVFYSLLKKYLQMIKIDSNIEKLLGDLLTGHSENETLKANCHLLDVKSTSEMDLFLNKYGHRSESLDIFQPTWKDNTDLLKLVNQNSDSSKLLKSHKQLLLNGELAERQCKNGINQKLFLIKPVLHVLYKVLLHYAREFTLLRENQRNEWHKILSVMRDSVKLQGTWLFDQKMLDEIDDVFFMDRLQFIVTFSNSEIDKSLIGQRKQEWHQSQLLSSIDVDTFPDYTFEQLKGYGVSQGVIRGRAHIARTLEQARTIKDNEILVAHSADPAWSPLFSFISGMVLETGGILSHASVVAREFGLATVTGIAGATQIIKNGDLLEINGETGIVEIIRK